MSVTLRLSNGDAAVVAQTLGTVVEAIEKGRDLRSEAGETPLHLDDRCNTAVGYKIRQQITRVGDIERLSAAFWTAHAANT